MEQTSDACGKPSDRVAALMLGATGVVFGDIGTSPLYTLREVFSGPLSLSTPDVLGILSLIFWALTVVVTLKYVTVVMRADNRGEGGVLALGTLAARGLNARHATAVACLGMLGMALFTGDSLITPAISVLSAVEGVDVVAPSMAHAVVPVTLGIVVALFLIQNRGTESVGRLFGPVMVAWFSIMGAAGASEIARHPAVLAALSPIHAASFLLRHGFASFLVLGSVVLAVTGGEALYADMGHFGRRAIKLSWLFLVLPCLVLNYFGQGALLMADPSAIRNPFYLLFPGWASWPMVLLATCATVIASQAVISGAFSLTRQAIQLNLLPRREVRHTCDHAEGQVYIPRTNWLLMLGVVLLVLGFRSSDALASAYGISVVGAMAIDTILAFLVARTLWKWRRRTAIPVFGAFLAVDLAFLASNLPKIPDGGWVPVMVAACCFAVMYVWRKGRGVLQDRLTAEAKTVEEFMSGCVGGCGERKPGTAVFLCGNNAVVPVALKRNIKHNKVLHERVLLVTVHVDGVPHERPENRASVQDLGAGFLRVDLRFGYMEKMDVPAALSAVERFDVDDASFFLSRETLIGDNGRSGLNRYQEPVFIALAKTATSAAQLFRLPPDRVVEMGAQLYI